MHYTVHCAVLAFVTVCKWIILFTVLCWYLLLYVGALYCTLCWHLLLYVSALYCTLCLHLLLYLSALYCSLCCACFTFYGMHELQYTGQEASKIFTNENKVNWQKLHAMQFTFVISKFLTCAWWSNNLHTEFPRLQMCTSSTLASPALGHLPSVLILSTKTN